VQKGAQKAPSKNCAVCSALGESMNIEITDAKNRFSVIDFGAGRDCFETTYICPSCSTKRILTDREFSHSLFESDSCIQNNTVSEINKVRPVVKENWEDFFDFQCIECGLEARVIYAPNEFRMACYNFYLKQVVEVRPCI
jgi:hypothetical protein